MSAQGTLIAIRGATKGAPASRGQSPTSARVSRAKSCERPRTDWLGPAERQGRWSGKGWDCDHRCGANYLGARRGPGAPVCLAEQTGYHCPRSAQSGSSGLSAGKGIVRLPLNGQDLDQNNAISPSNGVGTTLNPGEKKIMLIRIANGGAAMLPVSIHLELGL
ncbi:MAG: hypothetical protein AMXMBFR19_04260 [Chthonomonadaceae bacterium]|uniref:Uncharacterized protein n=1 Tax=Candidatus Nitrosymbiomonas proteolyticus TaxID=2608984 RepID=A0A809R786_9BACT|nr:conserved hypothetical protein [Candidatus Nitrosymbiomonas proteolyticus]